MIWMELELEYIDRGGWIIWVGWGIWVGSGRSGRSGIYGWEREWQIWMRVRAMMHFLKLGGGTKLV